jgi:LacI family transcriptional regulator
VSFNLSQLGAGLCSFFNFTFPGNSAILGPKSPMKAKLRRIAVIGLPVVQSVQNFGSVAIANYAERMGNWRFVFAAEATVEAFQFLRKVNFDGAIVRILSPAMRRAALNTPLPLINVSSWQDNPGVPTVRHDYETFGRVAAEYLLKKGFRRFGCVIVPGGCIPKRAKMFLKTIQARGLKASLFHLRHPKPFLRQPISAGERKRFAEWVRRLQPPAALIFMDDWDAPVLMHVCRETGLEIPRDLVVMSIGLHSEILALCPVPLTAVQEDHETQMQLVVEHLEQMMSGRYPVRRFIEVPPLGVIERASTATLAIEDRVVARAVEYIRANQAAPISIATVADQVGISRATLDRRFRETIGSTPHNYLVQQRIRLAQDLLLAEPRRSLKEISQDCGFNNRRRLNLVFKQITGRLPAHWRQDGTRQELD